MDATTWSNELTNHVLELKTTDPLPILADAGTISATRSGGSSPSCRRIGLALAAGRHASLDGPNAVETELWPGEGREIYRDLSPDF
jgi:hypothetical protein